MLPIATQQYYGDAAIFASTQEAQGMSFPYTWTFVKNDAGSWVVKSREMGSIQ